MEAGGKIIMLTNFMIAVAAPLAAIPAEAFPARCLLQVEGKKNFSGRCAGDIHPDGSFSIGTRSSGWKRASPYFAYVIFSDDRNKGDATWNENPKSFHAESELGTVSYGSKSECWINERTKICWSKL